MVRIQIEEDLADATLFEPLPVDDRRGFPQTFSTVFRERTYHFRVLAALDEQALASGSEFFDLPRDDGHLVVEVELESEDGSRALLMSRKVVPGLVYQMGDISLTFTRQRVARANLNGSGAKGSEIIAGIGPRWA